MNSVRRMMIGIIAGCLLAAGSAWAGGTPVVNNGTVTINGQVWLKDASCFGAQPWSQAMSSCQNLKSGECGLTDSSKAGDWRLPNKDELVTAYNNKSSFTNVKSSDYWSSTTYAVNPNYAWHVYFYNGYVFGGYKNDYRDVRCVRGGQ